MGKQRKVKKYTHYEFDDDNEILRIYNDSEEIDGIDFDDLVELFLKDNNYKLN